jgi:hypothetical protein
VSADYVKQLTGYTGITSKHSRDAGMLVLVIKPICVERKLNYTYKASYSIPGGLSMLIAKTTQLCSLNIPWEKH